MPAMTLNALPLVNNVMVSPFCIFFETVPHLHCRIKIRAPASPSAGPSQAPAGSSDPCLRARARRPTQSPARTSPSTTRFASTSERPIVRPRLCPVCSQMCAVARPFVPFVLCVLGATRLMRRCLGNSSSDIALLCDLLCCAMLLCCAVVLCCVPLCCVAQFCSVAARSYSVIWCIEVSFQCLARPTRAFI